MLQALAGQAGRLPADLGAELPEAFREIGAESRLVAFLTRWADRSSRPLVLFLDEIDALRDETLLSVLRQLRSGYPERPGHFPQSVALIGLRDVRDYRIRLRPEQESLGTSSPFNIKVESLTLRNFTAEEIGELFAQHTADTGQAFTPEAIALAWELTRGQPWLVNALAAEMVDRLLGHRAQGLARRPARSHRGGTRAALGVPCPAGARLRHAHHLRWPLGGSAAPRALLAERRRALRAADHSPSPVTRGIT